MYFLIGIWGSDRRLYSAIKFFLYTLVGSVVMLLGILALYFNYTDPATGQRTFDITQFQQHGFDTSLQWWVFLAFFLGFSIKVPMFPFHTWLPDAHTDAPTAGSVILAAVLLKMGTYGFIRFSLPILPDATRTFVPMDRGPLDHRHRLRGAGGDGAARLEAAGRLLVGQPHGARHARDVRPQPRRHQGQHHPADQPRHLDRRALPPGRRGVRTAPHPADLGIRRALEGDAGLRGHLLRDDAVVDRPAGPQRVHRRVPDPPGHLHRQQDVGGGRRYRHRAGRGLHAVALPAHDVRQDREPEERDPAGHEPARGHDVRPAHHPGGLDRHLPDAVPQPPEHERGPRRRPREPAVPAAERERRRLRQEAGALEVAGGAVRTGRGRPRRRPPRQGTVPADAPTPAVPPAAPAADAAAPPAEAARPPAQAGKTAGGR